MVKIGSVCYIVDISVISLKIKEKERKKGKASKITIKTTILKNICIHYQSYKGDKLKLKVWVKMKNKIEIDRMKWFENKCK